MGYSISVNCKSRHARDRMLKFLSGSFRPWAVVLGGKDGDRFISDPEADLSYADGKDQIGFDHHSGWGLGSPAEQSYYYATLRWIALRVGQKRLRFDKEEFPGLKLEKSVPYITYDGCQHWPVLTSRPAKELRWCWVDRLGAKKDRDCLVEDFMPALFEQLQEALPKQKGKNGRDYKLRDDALELLGREVASQDFAGLRLPSISREERHKLVKVLLASELDQLVAPVRAEMSRLDGLWRESASTGGKGLEPVKQV